MREAQLGITVGIPNFENSAPETEKTAGTTLPSQPMKTMAPLFPSMPPSKIQQVIDKHIHCIVDPWDGSLLFTVFKWDKSMGAVDEIFIRYPPTLTCKSA